MIDPAFALGAAVIWAISPIYYRGFLSRFDFLSFNLLRATSASLVLVIPAMLLWTSAGFGFALLSGGITLACGDSLYLLAIRETGASIASPVASTYVFIIQVVGVSLGQSIPYSNFAAAMMIVLGVSVLSMSGEGKPRARGVSYALSGAVFWTIGQEFTQAATSAGGSTVPVTFTRNFAAAIALGVAFLLTRKDRTWPTATGLRWYGIVLFVIIVDLVVGSLLFVYSVSTIGVALTVIVTSVSPLLTQLSAKALGKESPSSLDYLGGVLIVFALVLAVAF